MYKHPTNRLSVKTVFARPFMCGVAIMAIFGSYRAGRMVPHSSVSDLASSTPNAESFAPKARTRAPITAIDKQTGIEIIPRIQADMFPLDWVDPTSPTSATAPEPELVPYAVEGIKLALRKYPATFLKKNLRRVYIVNNLTVDGQPCGGVNAPELKTIYVDLDNLDSNEVAAWSEETIHHEFAHLLADNHHGDKLMKSWAKLNAGDFKYGNGGTDAIRIGRDGDEITPEYLSQGFVEQYSKSDPNEDFATLCERMFSGDRSVQQAAVRYPLLRRKTNRVIAFYHELDHSFTETYFRKLQPSRK